MGFIRKIKRKQMNVARKQFMKDFKSQMLNFKKQVKCSKCDRQPETGENIDHWHINKASENIDLVCTTCYGETVRELTSSIENTEFTPAETRERIQDPLKRKPSVSGGEDV